MFFDISKANIEELQDDLFLQKQVKVSILRLDKIHPLVSGNKIFKLHYFLKETLTSKHKTILTFGGAYSNHLAATAFACKALQLNSIGIIRGEKPKFLSSTLQQCIEDGMQLKFITRHAYSKKDSTTFLNNLQTEFGDHNIVPEGGYHPLGAKGAALIGDLLKDKDYTHICTASGTFTTVAGLLLSANVQQTIITVPILKGISDTAERISYLTGKQLLLEQLQILSTYHFGGYAKKSEQLIEFMNKVWMQHHLPLDFVYTAKMLYAIFDCIKNNYFKKGSEIICLHTGGLQGNNSLSSKLILY